MQSIAKQRAIRQKKRKETEKLGKLLSVGCALGTAALLLLAVLFLAGAWLLATNAFSAEQIDMLHISALCTAIFPLYFVIPLDGFSMNSVFAVLMGAAGILMLFLTVALFILRGIFHRLTKERFLFAQRYVTRLRVITAVCAVLGVCQPLFLLLSALTLFLSCTFSYGSQVEDEADQTIAVQESVILAFAEIAEAKSEQTGQHVKRVSEYSRILAQGLGLPAEEVEILRIASMMHDVGKLSVPSAILDKPGKLTPEEFAQIKMHVREGERLLHNAPGEVMEVARRVALDHHEHWDGGGYLGKRGEEISREGRIVALADVFDALVSRRSYKAAWPPEEALREIVAQSGRQFDPRVVEVFQAQFPAFCAVLQAHRDAAPPSQPPAAPALP